MPDDTEMFRRKHKMLLETSIVALKFSVPVLAGFISVWSIGMKPYVEKGEWPTAIVFLGDILPLAVLASLTAASAFLSKAWTEFHEQKKANDTGKIQTVETKPTTS